MVEITSESKGLILNVPQWFEETEFLEWLNDPQRVVMSWHRCGEAPGDYSDTMVFVCPSLSGEGSDSDMPAKYWNEIVSACRSRFRPGESESMLCVRLTNLS